MDVLRHTNTDSDKVDSHMVTTFPERIHGLIHVMDTESDLDPGHFVDRSKL